MVACRAVPRLAFALLLFALPSVAAAQYDPSFRWSTLDTPHFHLHFHQGEEALAQHAARAAEAARARLLPRIGHAPEMTELVLSDDSDFSNGFATAFILPSVHLYASPPDDLDELNDYDDWVWSLVAHEYTHMAHLDDVRGIPRLVNHVFGELDVPNGAQPRWFIEGLAVFEESSLSSGGRERSALYEMYLRAQYLQTRLFRLDELSNEPTAFPRGATPYLYGSRLVEFAAQSHGQEALARYSHDYGGRLVPFALNISSRASMGESFQDLYQRWRLAEEAKLQSELDEIRSREVTGFTRVTRLGNDTSFARFLPDRSRVVYLERSADRPPELRSVRPDGTDDRGIAELPQADELALTPDGRSAILAREEVYHQFRIYDDLWRIDLATGKATRLTRGLRARAPDVSPDGTQIAVAINQGGGQMALALVPSDGGAPRVVYEAERDDQVYTPRFSPDGTRLVFSEHHGPWRDLALLDLRTGGLRRLTDDAALDLEPTFDPSGRYVVFASDRSGVYDLYALPLDGGPARQLTNLETGAVRPDLSRDGRELAFAVFGANGWDVATMPVDLEHAPAAPPGRSDRPEPPYRDDPGVTFPARPYSVWPTILPHYWLPILTADAQGAAVGALTSGGDIVGIHQYALSGFYGLDSRQLTASAGYTNHSFYPALGAYLSRALHAIAGGPPGALEVQTAGNVNINVPVSWIDRGFNFGADYELRDYDPLYTPVLRPDEPVPFLPQRGLSGSVGAGASYGTARGSANGISLEEGYSLHVSGRLASPWLGGRFDYMELTGGGTTYLRMPWALHQVLALRLDGGTGGGDLLGRKLFALGGASLADPVLAILQGQSGDAGLRGYPGGLFRGNRFVLGSAEYRFPIANVDRGLQLLPVYLRRLHGAVVGDVGEAADTLTPGALKPSVGVELRAEVLLAYQLPFTFRLGLARGLASEGTTSAFMVLGGAY